ncbi:MAG: hypothetical protein IKE20_06795 [Eggerthellaceae bacterium]|nr:hypothetical protein [Eggerthellaceae bacterium]
MSCLTCGYFNEDDTSMTVCMLHRRYTKCDWTCGDELVSGSEEEGDAPAQEAEDSAE